MMYLFLLKTLEIKYYIKLTFYKRKDLNSNQERQFY